MQKQKSKKFKNQKKLKNSKKQLKIKNQKSMELKDKNLKTKIVKIFKKQKLTKFKK